MTTEEWLLVALTVLAIFAVTFFYGASYAPCC